jgi:hypothetical protein
MGLRNRLNDSRGAKLCCGREALWEQRDLHSYARSTRKITTEKKIADSGVNFTGGSLGNLELN